MNKSSLLVHCGYPTAPEPLSMRWTSSNLNIKSRSSREKNAVLRPQSEGFEIEMPHHSVTPGTCETVHHFSADT